METHGKNVTSNQIHFDFHFIFDVYEQKKLVTLFQFPINLHYDQLLTVIRSEWNSRLYENIVALGNNT